MRISRQNARGVKTCKVKGFRCGNESYGYIAAKLVYLGKGHEFLTRLYKITVNFVGDNGNAVLVAKLTDFSKL